jgi:HAD superfamily phosphoserine phosphatase-like hydrolase
MSAISKASPPQARGKRSRADGRQQRRGDTARRTIGLVAFDLDGTLVRTDTCCETIARPLGRLARMREFERLSTADDIAVARAEMATWYSAVSPGDLCAPLGTLPLAPGTREGFRLLRRHGVQTAIVSITWEFAVAWFAQQLRADYYVGTGLAPDGQISHFWPADKARWLAALAHRFGLDLDEVAAVGDSAGDLPML